MWNCWDPCSAPQTLTRHIISLSLQKFCITSPALQFLMMEKKMNRKWEHSSLFIYLCYEQTADYGFCLFGRLSIKGHLHYVCGTVRRSKRSLSSFHMNNWSDLSELINILWVIWVSSCALQCAHESRCLVKILTRGVFHIPLCAGFLCQLHTISSYTGTFRVKGSYLHLLSLYVLLMLAQ